MLITLLAYVQRYLKKYFLYRRTMYELNSLTNRDLADLGINRGDIEFLARKHSMSKI